LCLATNYFAGTAQNNKNDKINPQKKEKKKKKKKKGSRIKTV